MAVRSQVFLNYLDDASSGNIVDEATLFLAGNGLKQQALLAQLDEIKRHFRSQIGSKVGERRQHFLKPLLDFLKAKDLTEQNKYHASSTTALDYLYNEGAVRTSFSAANARSLPRILLLAESGAGKTAVTQYLARRTSPDGGKLSRPVKRIAIPDYLSNTGTLEYDLFGFMKGAYTSAPEEGNPGALLSNIGGIIFLDEIGDASPAIQAKLLAFMDDYKVGPRGWSREGFFCPVMIVAATNRPIDQWAAQDEQETLPDGHPRFRHDLFQRFNIVIRLPNLNERKKDSELPALVDALLQTSSVNPCNRITKISYKALEKLQNVNYQRANFRLLSRLLAQACSKASPRAEKTICSSDITLEADHDHTKAC